MPVHRIRDAAGICLSISMRCSAPFLRFFPIAVFRPVHAHPSDCDVIHITDIINLTTVSFA